MSQGFILRRDGSSAENFGGSPDLDGSSERDIDQPEHRTDDVGDTDQAGEKASGRVTEPMRERNKSQDGEDDAEDKAAVNPVPGNPVLADYLKRPLQWGVPLFPRW